MAFVRELLDWTLPTANACPMPGVLPGAATAAASDTWSAAWVLRRLAALGMFTVGGAVVAALVSDILSPYWWSPDWSAQVQTHADRVAGHVGFLALVVAVGSYAVSCCAPWRRISERLMTLGLVVFFGGIIGEEIAAMTNHPALEHALDDRVVAPLLLGAIAVAALPTILRGLLGLLPWVLLAVAGAIVIEGMSGPADGRLLALFLLSIIIVHTHRAFDS
jgi:hypothetical protein